MKTAPIVVALFALAATAPALAAGPTATPGVDQRQTIQEKRIEQGVQSGQITPREATRLEKGQGKVERMEEKAKSDGTVTRQERQRLHQQQDVQSRHIQRESHDRQRDLNHDGRMDRKGKHYGKQRNPGKHYGKEGNPGKHKGWRNKK